MSTTEEITVGVGTEFRSIIADGNALWRVIRSRGNGVWEAEVQPEWAEVRGERMMIADYVGTTDVFTTERIAGSINMDNVFARLANDSDFFWEDRVEGSIVHYHDSFGRYVRGRIVVEDGRHVMLPIALVGKWEQRDLVSWTAWGEISKGYHVRKIEEGETMRPHATNLYEHPKFSAMRYKFIVDGEAHAGPRGRFAGENPREAKAIDLTPPERSPEEVAYHEAVAVLTDVRNIVDCGTPGTIEGVRELLALVRQVADR